MKKIFVFLTAIMLIASMAIPAYAVTPPMKVPDVPQISKIKFNVTMGEDFWDNYFKEHPINWGSILNTPVTKELTRWKQ